MDHKETGKSRGKSRALSYNNQSKSPNSGRKAKRPDRRKQHGVAAPRVATVSTTDQFGRREFKADDLSEAVIWVRELDPSDKTTKPLITNGEATIASPSVHTPEERPIQKSEKPKKLPSKVKNDSTKMNTSIEHPTSVDRPPESANTERQRADHEPTVARERNYFWNQADIYQPASRDVLPSVEAPKPPSDTILEADQTDDGSKNSFSPSLEYAVNPNEAVPADSYQAAAQPNSEVKSDKRKKSGLMARRREKRAVKSQAMEGEAFERAMPAAPYAESTPVEREEYPEPEPLPGEPAESFAADYMTENYPDAKVETNGLGGVNGLAAERADSHERPSNEHAETAPVEHSLERTEQLEIARSITMDGVSVYEMFVARRIDEDGLRKIIVEYLRGGDLRDVIKNEIIRQQLKFERDPQLRSTPVGGTLESTKNIASSIKDRAKSVAGAGKQHDTSEKLAVFTHNAIEKSHEYLDGKHKTGQMAGIVAIVVIYITILIVAIAK